MKLPTPGGARAPYPLDCTGLGVWRYDVIPKRVGVNETAGERHAAIDHIAARRLQCFPVERIFLLPQDLTGGCIQRDQMIHWRRDKQVSAIDDRRRRSATRPFGMTTVDFGEITPYGCVLRVELHLKVRDCHTRNRKRNTFGESKHHQCILKCSPPVASSCCWSAFAGTPRRRESVPRTNGWKVRASLQPPRRSDTRHLRYDGRSASVLFSRQNRGDAFLLQQNHDESG